MLYVFLVDTGTVMTFDMNLALETVANLKEVIFKATKVSPEKQILLISGGQPLEPSHRVCSYSAGTDTNPIFLFCRTAIESSVPPSPSINYGSAQDLKDKVEACLADKEATYNTVVARAQLAAQLYDTARDIARACEQLVHDQHLQQQGWASVIANLDDIVAAFRVRAEAFEQALRQYLNSRTEYRETLNQFGEDLNTLAAIPVLPALLESPRGLESSRAEMSLLDWIHLNDDENTNLHGVADICTKGLETLEEGMLTTLLKLVDQALRLAETPKMKEINGLGERLNALEQLLIEARKKVSEQGELAQSLYQNQQRARNLNDPSILPDLCASHRQQLKVMIRHDEKLRDIRNRCSRAKEELSANLHQRLRWVTFAQQKLAEVDSSLFLQNGNLRRMRRHIDLLRQLHAAPGVYLRSLVEIARRRQFAATFIEWARALAGHSQSLHQEEVARRKAFGAVCEGNFLTMLFPGVTDQLPPAFATNPPAPFDTALPCVTIHDLQRLKEALPSLWTSLNLPDNLQKALKEPPLLHSLYTSGQKMTTAPTVEIPSADCNVLPSLSAALLSPPIRAPRSPAANSRKLIGSPAEFHATPEFFTDDSRIRELEDQVKEQRSRLLEFQSRWQCLLEAVRTIVPQYRAELNDLRAVLVRWNTDFGTQVKIFPDSIIREAVRLLERERDQWRDKVELERSKFRALQSEKDEMFQKVQQLEQQIEAWRLEEQKWRKDKERMETETWNASKLREQQLLNEKADAIQQLTSKHQSQVEGLEEEIRKLRAECDQRVSEWQSAAEVDSAEALRTWRQEVLLGHEVELEQMKAENEAELEEGRQWRQKYENLLKESDSRLQQLQDEMQHKHRLELEGLRSRFRIMAASSSAAVATACLGERSPSDSSLEKFEIRPTPPASPRTTVRPLTESQWEDPSWTETLGSALDRWRKERDRVASVVEEFRTHCQSSKATKWEDALLNALRQSTQTMCGIAVQLEQQREKLGRSQSGYIAPTTTSPVPVPAALGSASMSSSVAVLLSDEKGAGAAASTTKSKKKPMSRVMRNLIRQGSANVYNCEIGDTVLVQWDERYSTHMLYNKGPYLHFLHADSIAALVLKGVVEPFLARVVQREFCLVRKEENRYNLPKGTNFYRVKVERWSSPVAPTAPAAAAPPST